MCPTGLSRTRLPLPLRPRSADADNMFIDHFGFQAAEDTRYDVAERVAAEVGKPFFGLLGRGWRTDYVFRSRGKFKLNDTSPLIER